MVWSSWPDHHRMATADIATATGDNYTCGMRVWGGIRDSKWFNKWYQVHSTAYPYAIGNKSHMYDIILSVG